MKFLPIRAAQYRNIVSALRHDAVILPRATGVPLRESELVAL
jgi:hypothetical protein